MGRPQPRRPRFEYPDDLVANWHPRLPELACAANAVSLMMPHVEPYVVRAVREVLPHLTAAGADEQRVADGRAYVAQESQHHAQHRRFNELVTAEVAGARLLDRACAVVLDRLWRKRSERFHLAYAAASEAVAYGAARWVERHLHLFAGADPVVSSLFLWHLAEEVEHKNVAFDLYDARYRSRWPLAGAMAVSMFVLFAFACWGTTLGLWHERRLFRPVAVARLMSWSATFVFAELPNMATSLAPGHRPSDFADPAWFDLYLAGLDASSTPVAATGPGLSDSERAVGVSSAPGAGARPSSPVPEAPCGIPSPTATWPAADARS